MKNSLTQKETEEENRKSGSGVPLINKELDGNVLLIDKELAEFEDDVECASLPKLKKLV